MRAIIIEPLAEASGVPLGLLLLADPCKAMIARYRWKSRALVAKDEGRIIGAALTMGTGPGVEEIMNLAVQREHRRRGIGSALLDATIRRAESEGCRSVEIGTGNSSLDQLAFYQRRGFRIVGVLPDFFRANYPEAIFENGIECRDMVRLRLDLDYLARK